MAKTGRRAQMLATDRRPGEILALALLANAPIFVGFVIAPLLTGGDPATGRAYAPWVLYFTAPLAIASLGLFLRTKPERRAHRAARIGALLAVVALALWALVLAPWIRG